MAQYTNTHRTPSYTLTYPAFQQRLKAFDGLFFAQEPEPVVLCAPNSDLIVQYLADRNEYIFDNELYTTRCTALQQKYKGEGARYRLDCEIEKLQVGAIALCVRQRLRVLRGIPLFTWRSVVLDVRFPWKFRMHFAHDDTLRQMQKSLQGITETRKMRESRYLLDRMVTESFVSYVTEQQLKLDRYYRYLALPMR